jgi:hypothetical protein
MGSNEVFLDCQTLEDLPAFRAVGKAHAHHMLGTRPGDILAVEGDGASGWPRHPRNRVQKCRFSSAVRSEDDDDLAIVDFDVDVLKNADASVSRAEPGDL